MKVALGYFFNRSKNLEKYEYDNSPFKKTNLRECVHSFFEHRFNEEIKEEDKNLDYIISDGNFDRSDLFRKAREHFKQDMLTTMIYSGLIW